MATNEVYVHTPLGFDIANPMRCVSAVLGDKNLKIKKLYIYVPSKKDRRNEEALNDIVSLTEAMGFKTEIVELPFEIKGEEDFIESIFKVYKKMEEGGRIITCLGGGMRQIVLMLFSASIMISSSKDVEVFIQPEEKGVRGTFISGRLLRLIASMAKDKDIAKQILIILASKKEGMRLQDIYKELTVKEKLNVSRTTIHNYLKNLLSQKIIRELEGGYYTIY